MNLNMQRYIKILLFGYIFYGNILVTQESIMTYEEYVTIEHARPYMYALLKEDQALFYFGANHSCEPEDEQYQFFNYFWNEFLQCTQGENCVILVEGALRRVYANRYDAIAKAGAEGGLLTFLANQYEMEVLCPEPDKDSLRAYLLQKYTQDQIDYLDFAHIVIQFHRYRQVHANLEFENFYHRYNFARSFESMKEIHVQIFGTKFDVFDKQFFDNICNPVDQTTIINQVVRSASQMRDEIVVANICELINQGKNIFIAYGATHAVMQKAAITSLWNK